jgi:hypothetical protein
MLEYLGVELLNPHGFSSSCELPREIPKALNSVGAFDELTDPKTVSNSITYLFQSYTLVEFYPEKADLRASL